MRFIRWKIYEGFEWEPIWVLGHNERFSNAVSYTQCLANPIHLNCAHSSRVAAVCEDKFIVHDGLDFFTKKPAGWMDSDSLVADYCLIASIRENTCGVGRESFQKTFQDGICHIWGQTRNLVRWS